VKAGNPIRCQKIRLPASVWQKLRVLAGGREGLDLGRRTARRPDEHFEREWPKVRAHLDAVETA
jgi:hypothetical protein